MSKYTLTELLERGELDVREERIKRPNLTIWNLIQNELGGAYVLSLATGGGAGMGVARVIERTPAAEDIWIRKIIEGFQRYDELEKLSETKIKSRLAALVRLEIAKQQQEYINKSRYKADFPYWLKMATWGWDEGAALIHGLEPRTIKPPYPDSNRELFPIIKSWLECREHATRALNAGQLRGYSKPVEFLRWAESIGYPIPKSLKGHFGGSEAITKRVNNESQPVSAIALKKPKRADVLSPLINRAIKECCSDEISDVWNTLRDYANAKVSPLYGIVEEGLQYRNQKDETKYLSKKALGARLKRLKTPR
jgi:hypothetical protein